MIRLALRQFRTQAAIALLAVAATAVLALATHGHLAHLYDTTVATCAARGDCDTTTTAFLNADRSLRAWLGILVLLAPALVGLFWGAPLVAREFETGTFRLAWTQSVTRTRWLLAKVVVVGSGSIATAGLLSLVVTRWAGLADRVGENAFGAFDQRDLVPLGHAAFAFALGLALGVVIRRATPAMGATLVGFVATRLLLNTWVRPRLLAPSHLVSALGEHGMGFGSVDGGTMTLRPNAPPLPNVWITSIDIVDGAGHGLTPADVQAACPLLGSGGPPNPGRAGVVKAPDGLVDNLRDCVAKLGATYHQVVTYQPATRYWPLQWLELGLYAALAAVLVGASVWWVRRRRA